MSFSFAFYKAEQRTSPTKYSLFGKENSPGLEAGRLGHLCQMAQDCQEFSTGTF